MAEKHYYIDPILVQDAIYDFQELRYVIHLAIVTIITLSPIVVNCFSTKR